MTSTASNPRAIKDDDFPAEGTLNEKLQFLLNYAVLAPSSHNTQPWFFRIEQGAIDLYADWSRRLPVVDPQGRELIMSCGAALLHLELAIRHFGHEPEVETCFTVDDEPPILLARISLGKHYQESVDEQLIFESIRYRATNRLPFKHDDLPGQLINELEDLVSHYGTHLHVAWKAEQRQQIARLVEQAERTQFSDKSYREELASWIHSSRDERHDGMPPHALGLKRVADWMTPLAALSVRMNSSGAAHASNDAHLAADAPLLAVLSTTGDTPLDWIASGQAMAHLLLLACAWGASASFFNQPIESEPLRESLGAITGVQGFPQFLVRIGFGEKVEPTPRRPVEEVLLREVNEAELQSK